MKTRLCRNGITVHVNTAHRAFAVSSASGFGNGDLGCCLSNFCFIQDNLGTCGRCNMYLCMGDSPEANLLFRAKHDVECRARVPPHMKNWVAPIEYVLVVIEIKMNYEFILYMRINFAQFLGRKLKKFNCKVFLCSRISESRRLARLPLEYTVPKRIYDNLNRLQFYWKGQLHMQKPWQCFTSLGKERLVFAVKKNVN